MHAAKKEPHCVTSLKTPFFIATAVKTSNLTSNFVAVDCFSAIAYFSIGEIHTN
jgi:hypothetical protein